MLRCSCAWRSTPAHRRSITGRRSTRWRRKPPASSRGSPTSYAITERGADQHLQTRLFDRRSSAVLASADYSAADEGRPATWRGTVGKAPVAIEETAAPRRHTTWANTQLRELWLDQRTRSARGAGGVPEFATHRGVWRMRDAVDARRPRSEAWTEDTDVEAIATEYGATMAVVSRDAHEKGPHVRGTARSTFTARMFDAGGRVAGWVRWFEKERVLTWSFPNGRRGTAMESKVPGGFKFTPTMGWANVQALAFLKQSGRPAPGTAARATTWESPGAADSGEDAVPYGPRAPEPAAGQGCDGQADGCTGLHFLDGSDLRGVLHQARSAATSAMHRGTAARPGVGSCRTRSGTAPAATSRRSGVSSRASNPTRTGWTKGRSGSASASRLLDWCAPECASCRTREDTSRN